MTIQSTLFKSNPSLEEYENYWKEYDDNDKTPYFQNNLYCYLWVQFYFVHKQKYPNADANDFNNYLGDIKIKKLEEWVKTSWLLHYESLAIH